MNPKSIPNSNNLFTILTDMVNGLSTLMETVFKAKLSPKKVNKAKDTLLMIINATGELSNALNEKLKDIDTKVFENAKNLLLSLKEMVTVFDDVKYKNVFHAYFILHSIRIIMFKALYSVISVMFTIGPMLSPILVTIKMIQLTMSAMVSIVKDVSSISWIRILKAKHNLEKLCEIFGTNGITSNKFSNNILGIVHDTAKINIVEVLDATLKMLLIKTFIVMAVSTLSDIALLAIIGPFAKIGIRFLRPIIKSAVSVMEYVFKKASDIMKGSIAMSLLMASITITVASLLLVGVMIVKGWKYILWGMLGFVAVVGMVSLVCLGLGALMNTGILELGIIALGLIGLSLLAFSAALLVFVSTIYLLNKIDIQEDVFLKVIKPFGVMMQYMFDNFKIFNPLSIGINLITVGMLTVMSVLVLVLAVSTLLISKLVQNMKEDVMVEGMKKILHPWWTFNQYLWDNSLIFNPVSIGINLVTIGLLTGMSVLVLVMALMTRWIAKVAQKIDGDAAVESFKNIIRPYNELMDYVWDEFGLLGTLKLTHTIATLGELVVVAGEMGVIAHVLADIASLKMATEWNGKGKATNYKQLSGQDLADAALNGAGLVQIMAGLFGGKDDKEEITVKLASGDVTFNPINLKSLEGISRNTKKKMKLLSSITKCTGDIAHTLGDIASMRYPVEFDENGNPKKYENITGDVLKEAAMSAANLIKIMTGMFSDEPGTVLINGETVNIPQIDLKSLENTKKKSLNKVKAALGAVEPLSAIVDTVYRLANMEVPSEKAKFNPETGKWDDYVKLDSTHIGAVTTNMQIIMDSLITAVNTVINGNTKIPHGKDVDNIGKLFSTITSPISTLASMYSENKDMDLTKFDSMVQTMLKTPLDTLNSLDYDAVTMDTRLKHAKSAADIMEKMAGITVSDGVANVTDAHVKFLKQVNSTKLENLKYANSLMANMHKITKDLKGNFDRLADTLNEDIIEQLKEVAKLLDEINNKGVKPEIGVKQQAAPALSLTGNQTEKVPGTDPVKALQEALSRMKWKLSVPSGTGTIDVTLSSI